MTTIDRYAEDLLRAPEAGNAIRDTARQRIGSARMCCFRVAVAAAAEKDREPPLRARRWPPPAYPSEAAGYKETGRRARSASTPVSSSRGIALGQPLSQAGDEIQPSARVRRQL